MLVVVGGHSRNVGKTGVIAGIIAASPDARWTAIKITQFGHGLCSEGGAPCGCAVESPEHPFAITEEQRGGDPSTDSGRFLAAGAERAYWVRTAQGQLAEAMPAVRQILGAAANAIVESNTLTKFLRPDVYLAVLDPRVEDFKASALEALDRADAVVMTGAGAPRWSGVSSRLWESKPRFAADGYRSEALNAWLRERLTSGCR